MKTREYTSEQLWSTPPYNIILSYLKHGADKAISKRKLCQYTGLDERILRRSIETIRRNNICIISDINGYYYPLTRQEIESYIRRTERTAKSTFYTLRAAKNALTKMKESE